MKKNMQIEFTKIEEVFSFVRRSIYQLEHEGIHNNHIKVLMPNFFKKIMQCYYDRFAPLDNKKNLIFDVEILSHYKNEIVVFYDDYSCKEEDSNSKIFNLEL